MKSSKTVNLILHKPFKKLIDFIIEKLAQSSRTLNDEKKFLKRKCAVCIMDSIAW